VATAPGYSLLAKAVLFAISVVKGRSCSRWNRYKQCTKSDISVATREAINGPFW